MALDQVLGAALSTAGGVVVGVFLFWWRSRAEEQEEVRQWYAKSERLAERVINAQASGKDHRSEDDRAPYVRNTCAGVQTNLANHLANAPVAVKSDVVAEAETLVEKCQNVKDIHLHPSQDVYSIEKTSKIYRYADDATEQAKVVQKEAAEARLSVSSNLL